MMNHYRDIIKAPIMTEKSAIIKENGSYVFKVDVKANKTEIKQAIEALFNVKVLSVNTVNVKAKRKVRGRIVGFTSKYKKAIVKLAEGNDIDLN